MAAGSLTLGGNLSIALGPLGRNGEALGSLNTSGTVAAMYSYSKTRGLFGGISVEGSVIVERQDANQQAYHSPVNARMLLGGVVDPPEWASYLVHTLESCTGMPGGRKWIQDERADGTYAFGGLTSSAAELTPSFQKKKTLSSWLSEVFPWGKRKGSGYHCESQEEVSRTQHRRERVTDWDQDVPSSPLDPPFEFNNPRPRLNQTISHSSSGATQTIRYSRSSSVAALRSDANLRKRDSKTNRLQSSVTSRLSTRPELNQQNQGVGCAIALYDFKALEVIYHD
ncbi:hypothetical protein C0989_011997 [Termitomyces sp. Mn162]|nr:hypothetical protein C0989_011997 [Termitomyces sp. Mn162]